MGGRSEWMVLFGGVMEVGVYVWFSVSVVLVVGVL